MKRICATAGGIIIHLRPALPINLRHVFFCICFEGDVRLTGDELDTPSKVNEVIGRLLELDGPDADKTLSVNELFDELPFMDVREAQALVL